jgi:outer membrane immunogenic protein
MKRILLAGVGLLALATLAQPVVAADLPRAPVVKAPAAVAPFSWTGCYIGGNVGGIWARKKSSEDDPAIFDPLDRTSHTQSGVAAGGQLGCDYQSGAWVYGVQGMFDWTHSDATTSFQVDPQYSLNAKLSWFATITARLAYAVQPATLVYLKGGGAWVREKFRIDLNGVPFAFGRASTPGGWTIGVGVEHMFLPGWSAFLEYAYLDFGTKRTGFTLAPPPGDLTVPIKQHVHAVLVGLNYRFATGTAPVVTKY